MFSVVEEGGVTNQPLVPWQFECAVFFLTAARVSAIVLNSLLINDRIDTNAMMKQ